MLPHLLQLLLLLLTCTFSPKVSSSPLPLLLYLPCCPPCPINGVSCSCSSTSVVCWCPTCSSSMVDCCFQPPCASSDGTVIAYALPQISLVHIIFPSDDLPFPPQTMISPGVPLMQHQKGDGEEGGDCAPSAIPPGAFIALKGQTSNYRRTCDQSPANVKNTRKKSL